MQSRSSRIIFIFGESCLFPYKNEPKFPEDKKKEVMLKTTNESKYAITFSRRPLSVTNMQTRSTFPISATFHAANRSQGNTESCGTGHRNLQHVCILYVALETILMR